MKTITWKHIMSLVLASALLAVSDWTPAAGQSRDHQTLEEVVVTATRTWERPIDVPVSTEVIDVEDIEKSGAADVGDLIAKYVPGHFHKYNGLLSPVGLRGFRSESHGDDIRGHVLLLVDGHRIGTGNAAKINLDLVERVEVTKGPASALYGSAAMGGVINLITKKGEGDLTATVKGEYGSFDNVKAGFAGGGAVNDRFKFYLTASYEDIGDYDDPQFGTVYNSGMTKKNIGGNLLFAGDGRHELRLGGNFADLRSQSPDWTDGAYSGYVADTRKGSDKSHGYGDLEYNGDFFGSRLHWRGLAYYLWDLNHWKSGYPLPDSSQSKYTDTTLGTDHQFAWTAADWNTLLLGFTVEHLEKESEAVSGGLPAMPYIPGMQYDSQALFLQESVDLWRNKINLIAAARWDRFEVETRPPETGDFTGFNAKSEDYDHISPKAGVSFKIYDELLRLRVNAGEGFKTPSADQLSADYLHSNGTRYLGNPELAPETSLTYDAGFDLFLRDFTLKAGYFHSDYENKIVQVRTTAGGLTTISYENRGEAEIAGFDAGMQWAIGRTFGWPAEVGLWSNATLNTIKEDKETGDDLLYISDYEVKSGLDLEYRFFTAQLSHALVGPQMITNYDTGENEEKGRFDFWDLTLRCRFRKHWEALAAVQNLFDDRIEWVRGNLMPERNYRVGIAYTF